MAKPPISPGNLAALVKDPRLRGVLEAIVRQASGELSGLSQDAESLASRVGANESSLSDLLLGSIHPATTGGTSTAYTLTTGLSSPPADGDTIFVNVHTTCGDNPTLNVDSLGAWEIDYYNGFKAQAGAIRPGVHRFTRSGSTWVCDDPDEVIVDGNALSSDYALQVGERIRYSASAVTSLALRIATDTSTGIYKLSLTGAATGTTGSVNLLVNNTTYSSQFAQMFAYGTYPSGGTTSGNGPFSSMPLGLSALRNMDAQITTGPTGQKMSMVHMAYYDNGSVNTGIIRAVFWNQTSVAWSSLGTISFPQAWSGTISVTRIQ